MSDLPRHTSLEKEFRAAMPLPRAPWTRRLLWRVAMKLLSLRFVQKMIEKRYGT
ncbi:MAG: hypothetical protein ABI645_12835 [Pseudomonadota bacterium]